MKRNVLQLIGSFHQGGSERQAAQLTRLLCNNGRYNVRVACLEKVGVLLNEVERLNLGEIPEYALTSFYSQSMVVQLRRFTRFLRENRIDVVQTHDFYTNVFGMIGARLAHVPVRIAARRETGGIRTRKQLFVERRAYALAHAIVTNAEAVKLQLVKEGLRDEKIVTLYNGLDLERLKPSDSSGEEKLNLFGLPTDAPRKFVTIVANLRYEVKDHSMFLRAAKRVKEHVKDAAFVIAGEGELIGPMRELAANFGIASDTHFIGRCENVAEVLAISHVCVLSSKAEGFSNSILEYMAASRPVIATNVGGASEAIIEGETGYLVASGDDETMAARIVSLLKNPDKAEEMGQRGRRRVKENFSCEAQLESTLNLYERLLDEHSVEKESSFSIESSEGA